MSLTTFDFTILGDTQPEGLLVASALVRRGYSVQVVSSVALGEKASKEEENWIFPSSLGAKQLSDVFFRAGFFRYEDAALVPHQKVRQLLLPKNRLTFTGSIANCLSEVEREFPHLWSSLSSLYQLREGRHKSALHKTLQKLMDIQRRDSQVRDLVALDSHWTLRPGRELSDLERLKYWVESLLRQSEKHFSVDPQLGKSYCAFLSEHARKWGVVFNSQALLFKSLLVGYQISKETRSSSLIVNSLGANRLLARSGQLPESASMDFWMYEDSFSIPLDELPEPYGEQLYFYSTESSAGIPHARSLKIERDFARGMANLKLGSWLPFDDTKMWHFQIDQGRKSLRRLLPFSADLSSVALPSILDLTELRGETIKLGKFDKLIPSRARESVWTSWMRRTSLGSSRRPFSLRRRIYSLNPYDLEWKTRDYSFEKSLALLEHFERKKRSFAKV